MFIIFIFNYNEKHVFSQRFRGGPWPSPAPSTYAHDNSQYLIVKCGRKCYFFQSICCLSLNWPTWWDKSFTKEYEIKYSRYILQVTDKFDKYFSLLINKNIPNHKCAIIFGCTLKHLEYEEQRCLQTKKKNIHHFMIYIV